MLEILQNFIQLLINDSVLTAIVPKQNIFVGALDSLQQKQVDLLSQAIIITTVSEAVRTVPMGVRDTQVQLDIMSRTSQLELEQIYEEVLNVLNFAFGSMSGNSYTFWQRLGNAVDMNESDRHLNRRVLTFTIWSEKP